MKKIVPILSIICLLSLTGCKTLQDWFNKKAPREEIISKYIIKIESEPHFKKEVLASDKLTIVKFETDWCGACKDMAPVYEKLAEQFKDIKFTTVDTDKFGDIAKKYEIKGVPTFIFFKEGKKVDDIYGGVEEDVFIAKIKEVSGK